MYMLAFIILSSTTVLLPSWGLGYTNRFQYPFAVLQNPLFWSNLDCSFLCLFAHLIGDLPCMSYTLYFTVDRLNQFGNLDVCKINFFGNRSVSSNCTVTIFSGIRKYSMKHVCMYTTDLHVYITVKQWTLQ